MGNAYLFVSYLELAIYNSTNAVPDYDVAESLAKSAKEMAQNEMTQDHVPDELRGVSVGGVLNFLQLTSHNLCDGLIRRIAAARRTGHPVQLKLLAKDFNNLSRPDHFQYLEVLFLERDIKDAPFKDLANQIRFAAANTVELVISSIPVVGSIIGIYELNAGKTVLSEKPLSGWDKFFTGAGIVAEAVGLGGLKKIRSALSRPTSMIALSKLTRNSRKISMKDALRVSYFTKLLTDHDFVKLQKVVRAIKRRKGISRTEFNARVKELRRKSPDKPLKEAKNDVLKEFSRVALRRGSHTDLDASRNALLSKILTFSRAADAIELIDKQRKLGRKVKYFDDVMEDIKRSGNQSPRKKTENDALEAAAGKLLAEEGGFNEVIRMSKESTKKIAKFDDVKSSGLDPARFRKVVDKLKRRAKSADFLLDRRFLADATVLADKTEIKTVLNSIDKKAKQGSIVVIINDKAKYAVGEMKTISTQYFKRKIGRATRLVWVDTNLGRIAVDSSRPIQYSLTRLIDDYKIGRGLNQEMVVLKHLLIASDPEN